MKVLIIRFSSIGDIVLTSPVVRCLKMQIPYVEIHFLTKKNYYEILINNPNIDKIITLEDSIINTIKIIKSQKYDLIIDLHNNLRTLIIKTLCNTKSVSFDKLNFRKFFLVNFKINLMPTFHIVDRYIHTVKHLGVVNDGKGLDYFLPAQNLNFKENIIAKTSNNFICMAIGGQHFTKKLPLQKLKDIISEINSKIAIIGGKEDETIARQLEECFGNKVLNFAGKLNINESAYLISLSLLVISHDTGMMHIAAALKKPVIAVWGNTVPALGMYPYYGDNKILFKNFEVLNLDCRPCSKIGFDKCPKKHFKCMANQDSKAIALEAMEIKQPLI